MAGRPGRAGARACLIAALLCGACSSPPPPGRGVLRAGGAARGLLATADGAFLAYLDGCAEARARSLPAGTASCDLRTVGSGQGQPTVVARAVPTLPGAVAVSPAGAELAAVSGYDYAAAAGTLVRWRPGEEARELAAGVTFHGYGPDGTLGFVAGGELYLAIPRGEPAAVPGTVGAASFELGGQGGLSALVRRRSGAGGELLAVAAGAGRAVQVAAPVGDYGFGAGRYAFTRMVQDGGELQMAEARLEARPEVVARNVRAFAFAPTGDGIAYLSGALPGKQGSLKVRAGGRELPLGSEVGEFRWAARAARLAWLEEYDPRVRSGTLGVGGPDLARRTLGKNVSDLELAPDGRFVAFLQHTTQGGYTVDLMVAALDAPEGAAPRRVVRSAYGFAFSPDGRWLYYRTRCTRNGEACDLERVDPAAADFKAEKIAEGVKSFEFHPSDPDRVLVTWKRLDRDALDLGLWGQGGLTTLDTVVQPGSARFLGKDPGRVAYVVVNEKRAGVYVAEVP